MECVNDIVEIIQIETEEKNGKQNNVRRTLLSLDFVAENIKRNKHNGDDSAINIRQNILAAASDRRFKRGEMIRKKIKNIVIELIVARKCSGGRRARLETEICRNKGDCRKSDGNERAESEKQTRGYKTTVNNIVYPSVVNLAVLVNIDRLGRKNFLD